jgi:IS1 family transposase
VLDEIYSFLGRKSRRIFIWTALGFSDTGERLAFFHLDTSTGSAALERFTTKLPQAQRYYCDGNAAYPDVLGSRCRPGKGVMTNLIESLNSQVRQFVSRLRRKTKGYAKSMVALENSLALSFMSKIIG